MSTSAREAIIGTIAIALGAVAIILFILLYQPPPTPPDPLTQLPKDDVRVVMHEINWHVVEIEGCEYFYYKTPTSGGWVVFTLCHKGNCKSPIHAH